MAKETSNAALGDLLECCICAEEYSDPRMLPCIHTFCLGCLEKVGHDKKPADSMMCPMCRAEFKIPDTGFEGIQKNFFMTKLMDLYGLSKDGSKETLCDACQEDDSVKEVPAAVVICIECNQKLCDLCCQCHKKSRASKQHQLVDLKNKDVIKEWTSKLANSFCVHHQSEPLKIFCLDCSSAICCVCQGENHNGHKCSTVEKVGEEFRLQLRDLTGKISGCLESSESELLGKLEKTSQDILNQTEKLKNDVLKKAEEIKEMVDRHAQELMQEIELVKIKKQKEVETEKEEISRHMTMLESYERYVNEMIVKGSTVDICGTFHKMKIRAGELQKNHSDIIKSVSDHGTSEFISLNSSKLENILKDAENMIGVIKSDLYGPTVSDEDRDYKDEDSISSECEKQPKPEDQKTPNPVLVAEIKFESSEVLGMIWFEEKIYVVLKGSSSYIKVYSNRNPFNRYEQEDRITISDSAVSVEDMAIIKSKKMIVVLRSSNYVYKIKLPSKERTSEKFIGTSKKMLITSSDQLLIASKRGQPARFYLDIYTPAEPKFQLSKSILLSTKISVESNVVQTSTGNFIFAYLENNAHLISELSADGMKFIRTVNLSDLSVQQQPSYLAISKHDEVFITDTKGERILILNPELRTFVSPISRLQKLQYLQEEHQLIVGTTDARVLIYGLK